MADTVPTHDELERRIRERCEAGDQKGAAEALIRGFGPAIFAFLMTLHRDEQDAGDVFSAWTEALWRGLPDFRWESSLRTWAYAIARHTSFAFVRQARRQGRQRAPLPGLDALEGIAEHVRTQTQAFLRTEVKGRLAAIRETLPPEDQALLLLRLEQRLDWKDVARILAEDEAQASEASLSRVAQRLRKRFQALKERLTELARQEGLLGEGD